MSLLAWLPVAALEWKRRIREEDIEIVNIHFPDLDDVLFWIVLKACRVFHGSIVLSFHGADVTELRRIRGTVGKVIWCFATRYITSFIACSRSLSRELVEMLPKRRDAIYTVWNGVDAAKIRDEIVEQPVDGRSGRYIIFIGGFERKKGLDVMLLAFKAVMRSVPDIKLQLVCRGNAGTPDVMRLCQDEEFMGRVDLLVDCPHGRAMSLLANAEVLVMPSRKEPFGIVALEAAVLGRPVILTDVCGVLEMLESALVSVVPVDDPAKLASAILKVLSDHEAAQAAGGRLKASLSKAASWSRAAKELLLASGFATID